MTTDNQWHSLLAGFRKPFCDLQWIFPLYSGVHYPQMIAISVHDYSGVQASLWLLQWTSIFSQSSVMLLYPTTLSPTTESWDHPRNLSDYTDIHYRALVRGPQWTCLTVLTPQLLSKHSKSQWLPGYFQSVTDLPVTATETNFPSNLVLSSFSEIFLIVFSPLFLINNSELLSKSWNRKGF